MPCRISHLLLQTCPECVYSLLARYVPERTLLLAFGHDEEVGGAGARATAQLLQANGTELAWILDEGGTVLLVRCMCLSLGCEESYILLC